MELKLDRLTNHAVFPIPRLLMTIILRRPNHTLHTHILLAMDPYNPLLRTRRLAEMRARVMRGEHLDISIGAGARKHAAGPGGIVGRGVVGVCCCGYAGGEDVDAADES